MSLLPFNFWGKRGIIRLSNIPKMIQLVHDGSKSTQLLGSTFLTTPLCHPSGLVTSFRKIILATGQGMDWGGARAMGIETSWVWVKSPGKKWGIREVRGRKWMGSKGVFESRLGRNYSGLTVKYKKVKDLRLGGR